MKPDETGLRGKPDPRALALALADAADEISLRTVLQDVRLETLSTADYNTFARALEQVNGAPDVRVAYLANFTLDLLPRFVTVQAAAEGLRTAAHVGGFGQHVQEVLDPESRLHRFEPDLIFLALSLERLHPELIATFAALTAAERRNLREAVVADLASWAAMTLERSSASLLISNFASPAHPLFGTADLKTDYGQTEFFLELNLDLLQRFKSDGRVRIFDTERLAARFGKDRVLDRKLFHLAKMDWSPPFLPFVAEELVRHIRAVRGMTRKCLVLDLDNTLWGGVVGEEGAAGVKIGNGDPISEAFAAFHHKLKALQTQGVLLAVCSKNNPADVAEVFESRPDVPLRMADFAAAEISWEPKHVGLRKIAQALNLGLESFVFLDDNPAEIELVRQLQPEVRAVLLPPDPAEYPGVLAGLKDFERAAVLSEDRAKTEQYRQNRQREQFQAAAGDLQSYLASLETELLVRRARLDDLPRVHQLFSKTNQFNVTTIRYGPADVERFATSDSHELLLASARDRFGDLGAIAVLLLVKEGDALFIDSLLMSCRAMGRGIETALLNYAKERLFALGASELRARYVPTPKNTPVETLFERHGFQLADASGGGEKLYVLEAHEAEPQDASWIRLLSDDAATGSQPHGR